MLSLPPSVKIYLATGKVDMRKSIDGLLGIVRGQWQEDPFTGHLFVFVGRRRDRVKILCWDRGGFVVFYKRLEQGRFRLPKITESQQSVHLDSTQLTMLLDGINYSRVRRPRHWSPAGVENSHGLLDTDPAI